MNENLRDKTSTMKAVIFIVTGMLTLFLVSTKMNEYSNLMEHCEKIQARVVQSSYFVDEFDRITVAYIYNGQRYREQVRILKESVIDEGEKVTIIINKNNPREIIAPKSYKVALICGILFIVAGVVYYLHGNFYVIPRKSEAQSEMESWNRYWHKRNGD